MVLFHALGKYFPFLIPVFLIFIVAHFQDVGDLFRAGSLESHFTVVVEALYEGKRFVSQDAALNKVNWN